MNIFESCHKINDFLLDNQVLEARNLLIQLLEHHKSKNLEYSPLINRMIREMGLYPYIDYKTASWEDRFAAEAFKVDIGDNIKKTLHSEQSLVLKKLLEGKNVAISAPTSFGKSFIVDAFISIKKPNNVFIIVPTLALMDEVRRRLNKKFSNIYKIITSHEINLSDKNIFIFPQERALSYVDQKIDIDILIVDEFYKASIDFDKQRSPALLKAIIKLTKKSKQRYFLAPNIRSIKDNLLTKDMLFIDKIDFNTVCLQKYDLYKEIGKDKNKKKQVLLNILNEHKNKTIIYVPSHPRMDTVSAIIQEGMPSVNNKLCASFAVWLRKNYIDDWSLIDLLDRGVGLHNSHIHRPLSQIQIRLFEEESQGIDTIVSTSSIIEGVNTSAENVIIWESKKGNNNLDDFTYKNIIGRSGRMFKHFIGKVFLLDSPPKEEERELDLTLPDSILDDLDEHTYKESLTNSQIERIISIKEEISSLIGRDVYNSLSKEDVFQHSDLNLVLGMIYDMKSNPEKWNGLSYLNSADPESWSTILYKVLKYQPNIWEEKYIKIIDIIKKMSKSWNSNIVDLVDNQSDLKIFFKLERVVSYKLSSLLRTINELQKKVLSNKNDISPFITKISNAFLPPLVYQLEEYGLPRMISKKIHINGYLDLENSNESIYEKIIQFNEKGLDFFLKKECFDDFDKYILEYFFEGISVEKRR